jgi:hypothetical protein
LSCGGGGGSGGGGGGRDVIIQNEKDRNHALHGDIIVYVE